MHAACSQVFILSAGPFAKRGTYRLRVVLYDGFQPLMAGADTVVGASTARRQATEKEGTLVSQTAYPCAYVLLIYVD